MAERGGYPSGEATVAELTELAERFNRATGHAARVLPPGPPPPSEVRAWLRDAVTVVKPGETLVIRVPMSTTSQQLREYRDALADAGEQGWPKMVAVCGEELAVVQADSDAEFAARVRKVLAADAMSGRFPTRRTRG